jgi:hypothetical protein
MNLKGVRAGLAGLGEAVFSPETLAEASRASVRMVPVLALAMAGSVAEDVREGRPISNGTKVIAASFVTDLAVSSAAFMRA